MLVSFSGKAMDIWGQVSEEWMEVGKTLDLAFIMFICC